MLDLYIFVIIGWQFQSIPLHWTQKTNSLLNLNKQHLAIKFTRFICKCLCCVVQHKHMICLWFIVTDIQPDKMRTFCISILFLPRFSVKCTAGTVYNSTTRTCDVCPFGSYKGRTDMTCVICPSGETTESVGSTSRSDCIGMSGLLETIPIYITNHACKNSVLLVV